MDSSLEFPRVEKNTYGERVKMQRILLAKEFARCTTVIPRGKKSKQTNTVCPAYTITEQVMNEN